MGMQKLKLLWQGYLPLDVAFWQYAILYGLLVNVAATVGALFLVAVKAPIALPIFVHFSAVPYLVVTTVGVWRSADRYGQSGGFALFARIAVLAWSAFWFVA